MLLPCFTLVCRLSWPWVAAGAALSVLYYYIVFRRLAERSVRLGGFGKALLLLQAVALLVLTALISHSVSALFPQIDGTVWAGLGVLALAAFAAQKGVAAVLRCGSVLMVPMVVVFAAVLVLGLPSAKLEWLVPQGEPPQALFVLLLFLLPSALSQLMPHVRQHNGKPWHWAAGLGVLALAASAVVAARLSPALAERPMSFYTLSKSITVFGVMLRLEVFVFGALTAGAFLSMALLLCVAEKAVRTALPVPEQTPAVLLIAPAAALLSLLSSAILEKAALASAIFCVVFSVLTQAVGQGKIIEKKTDFFQKSS